MIKKMSEKHIAVSLAKIDYDYGKPFLKIIAHCPNDYKFNQMDINITPIDKQVLYYDGSNLINGEEDIVLSLPLDNLLNGAGPSMYYIVLGAENSVFDSIGTELYLSDVHNVYKSMLGDLLNSDPCNPVSDETIKRYLTLYGHIMALSDGKDSHTAEMLFKLMHKNFTKCGVGTNVPSNCGCHD